MMKIKTNPVCLWHFVFKIKLILNKIKLLMFLFPKSFHFCWIILIMAVFNTWVFHGGISTCSLFSSSLLSCLAFLQGSLFSAIFHPILGWHNHSILFQERPFYFFSRPAGIFWKSFAVFVAYLMFQVLLALAFSHNTPDSLMRQRLFVLTAGGQNSYSYYKPPAEII